MPRFLFPTRLCVFGASSVYKLGLVGLMERVALVSKVTLWVDSCSSLVGTVERTM